MTLNNRKKWLLGILFILAFFTSLIAVSIAWDGFHDQIESADVAIVLGNAVENGQPSPRLRSRLDVTVKLFDKGLFANVIVSGGIDSLGQDEAAVMKKYLTDCGVPQERILMDNAGDNTRLTAINAARIMKEHRLHSAMVISQWFHISRTKLALRRCNVECTGWAHANYFELRDLYSTAREAIGYFAYFLKC